MKDRTESKIHRDHTTKIGYMGIAENIEDSSTNRTVFQLLKLA